MGLSFSFGHLYEESLCGTDKKLVGYCDLIEFDRGVFNELGCVVMKWMRERYADADEHTIFFMTREDLALLFRGVREKTILFERGFEDYKEIYGDDSLYEDCQSDKEIIERFHNEVAPIIGRVEELSREYDIYFHFSH